MLICVFGQLGSGKSLFATMFAYFSHYNKIIANYKLNISNKEILPFSQDLVLDPNLSDALIIIDEAYIEIDSRTASSKENLLLSWVTFQSRKKNCDIIYCVQLFKTIDKRIRSLIHYYVFCQNFDNYFRYTILDEQLVPINQLFLPLSKAIFFFKMYDTNQLISGNKLEYLQLKVAKGKTITQMADEIIEEIKKLETFKELIKSKSIINKTQIKSMLLELNRPIYNNLVDAIYTKLNIYKKNTKKLKNQKNINKSE